VQRRKADTHGWPAFGFVISRSPVQVGAPALERQIAQDLISPLVAAQTRDALLAGWLSVQGPAGRVH
jgi:hypothetical protein